jgi:hypothetical protein
MIVLVEDIQPNWEPDDANYILETVLHGDSTTLPAALK